MASESWSSGTVTRQAREPSSAGVTSTTSAGESAEAMNLHGSSSYSTISIFSPPSSATMRFTRMPFAPMQAPTASTSGLWLCTAILVREPASRETALISTVPS